MSKQTKQTMKIALENGEKRGVHYFLIRECKCLVITVEDKRLYTLTHEPSGLSISRDFTSVIKAKRALREFWSMLNKKEKQLFEGNDTAKISDGLSRKKIQFLRDYNKS